MRTVILTYTQWWRLEESLNHRLPGDDEVPGLASLQEDGEKSLKEILTDASWKAADWEVPFHYHRCPVLFCYIYNLNLISLDLLRKISSAHPQAPLPWYAQLECQDPDRAVSGDIIIHDSVAYFNSEDSLVQDCAGLLSITSTKAKLLMFYSKIVSRPTHIKMGWQLWGWKGLFKW